MLPYIPIPYALGIFQEHKMGIHVLKPNHKIELRVLRKDNKLNKYSEKEMSSVFEEIVKWCIVGETEKFKEAHANKSRPIYKDLIESALVIDFASGYSIRGIVTVMGHIELMNFILQHCTSKHLRLYKYLIFAIMNEDVGMVKCILQEVKDLSTFLQRSYLQKHYHHQHNDGSDVTTKILGNSKIFDLLFERLQRDKEESGSKYIDIDYGDLMEVAKPNRAYYEFFILKNANPNIMISSDGSYLHKAVKYLEIQDVVSLLEHGAGMFILDDSMQTPLKLIQNEYEECKKKYMHMKDHREKHIMGKVQKIFNLLSSKMKKNRKSVNKDYQAIFDGTTISYPFTNKSKNIIKLTDSNTKTFQEFVTYCLNGNVNDLNPSKHGNFALYHAQDLQTGFRATDFAANQGHVEVVKKLLDFGATPETKDVKDQIIHSAIDIAISNQQFEVCKCLFEYGVETRDWMVLAVEKRQINIAEYLLDKVDINFIGSSGYCALHQAAINGNLEFVQFLLHNGAKIDKKSSPNKEKVTALHLAISHSQDIVTKYLIEHGADLNQKDSNGESILNFAQNAKGKDDLINFISSKINVPTNCQAGTKNVQSDSTTAKEHQTENSGAIKSMDTLDRHLQSNPEKISRSSSIVGKKRNLEESSGSDGESEPDTKSRMISDIENQSIPGTSQTHSYQGNQEAPEESTNPKDIGYVVQPLVDSLLKNTLSYQSKKICLSAIELIISKDASACDYLMKKEFVDEVGNIVEEIVYKESNTLIKDFEMIAKILAKLEQRNNEGKKLIGGMKMSFSAFDKLRTEMKKFETGSRPSDYLFDSDQSIKVKAEALEVHLD